MQIFAVLLVFLASEWVPPPDWIPPPRVSTLAQESAPHYPKWADIERIEQWRDLVDVHFLDEDVNVMLSIMACESNGRSDALNRNRNGSLDRGLFQHNSRFWKGRTQAAGLPDGDPWDPETNIQVAAWLTYWGGGLRHWSASRPCWD